MSKTKNKSLVHRIALTEARNNLGKVVRRAHLHDEKFILEKDGIPIAALINIQDFEDFFELRDKKINKQIKESYKEYLDGKAEPIEDFLAEISSGASKSK